MEERLRYLFQRYMDNSCSRNELEEFFGYVDKSSKNEHLRQLIRDLYAQIGESDFNTTTYVDENGRLILNEFNMPARSDARPQRKLSRLSGVFAVAAGIVIIVGIGWIIRGNRATNRENDAAISSLTKKSTNRSESKFILLEDSSRVWLNAASSLEFPDKFAPGKREVYLTGEAFFDVCHADKIPFIIHTGTVSTTVLGTAFNIKAYTGQKQIIISVSRGKVKVTRKDGWTATLTRGQQLKIEELGSIVSEKNIPAEDIASWHHGSLMYDDEPFGEIIADMERLYNVSIRIARDTLIGLRISTSFKQEIGIEQALQVLCRLTDTELKQENGVYIIQ